MKRTISRALVAVLLMSSITYAQGKDERTLKPVQDDRDGWSITNKGGYLGHVRMERDGLYLELADGRVFHSSTLKGWERIKVFHPEIMPLVDEAFEQLAPKDIDMLAIGSMLDMEDWSFMDPGEPDWNYYLAEPDPSVGGGGVITEQCRIAHNQTTATAALVSLSYIRLLAVCGSIAIPILGEVTTFGCLFQLGAHLVVMYQLKNNKDAEILACRGY